jgi:hypothetical protein
MRRSLAAVTMAAIAALATALPGGPAARVHAAEYELETVATYDVLPDAGRIEVAVDVTFTNTTPDPAGQFSVFDDVKLAVHDEATDAAATDGDGDLSVSLAEENDVNVATVELREGLRYEESVTITVTYVLPDGDGAGLRVRPSAVVFPAWGFGTASEVRVRLPDGFEARVDGDPLELEDGVLVSGEIDDPSRWLALVTAVGEVEYATSSVAVPLTGGTAELEVRAFADDEAWGERTLALVEDALPLIETEIGLPYPRLAPLVLTESVATDASGFGEAGGGTELLVAFDQPPFTAIHQVVHVWLSEALVDDRWIREGLASQVAARVAARLEVDAPYDPVAVAEARADVAFPLDEWSADAGPDGEAYGYAASWAFMAGIDERVGHDAVREVLHRVVAGIGPFRRADLDTEPSPDAVAAPPVPLTTRSFLDHLETITEVDLDDTFAADVLSGADAGLLPARAEARTALDGLATAAGAWETPDPVLGAMTAWTFDAAIEQIEAAAAWLERRDDLLDDMEAVGLRAPDRLRQAYRSYGGGPEAVTELDAQRAVVDAYAETAADVNGERTFIERVGLVGGTDPAAELALANGRFADGDIAGSVEAIAEAQRIVASAQTGGIVRVASAALIAIILLVLAALLYRRRASYTAAP